jgi:hypothetical protein
MGRLGALALVVTVVLAGCGVVDGTSPPSASSGGQTATPTPSASGGAMELQSSRSTALAPGRYTRTGFQPQITFAVETRDWYAVQLFNGFFDIQQDVGSLDVIAVQFARPSALFGAGGEAVPAPPAGGAADILRANPSLKVIETSTSQIGGLHGFQVTVEHAAGEAAQVIAVPPGPLSILPGRRLWMAFFDTPTGLLAIMVGGSVAKWEEALAAAEPVLESIEIGN